MHKHSRYTVLGLAVLGLALIAAPAFAANLFTVNDTEVEGVTGSKAFVPTFISSADPSGVGGTVTGTFGVYIPYLGTMTPCRALIGQINTWDETTNPNGGCSRWGQASIEGWAQGLYYDPRFGTPFIPPSGDHHRTAYRMLLQPSFSGGMWLSGFAPLTQRFPYFPQVGTAGPGGDVGLALAQASVGNFDGEAGINAILALMDAHGEPLTAGKFPRYWPHERAAWVDTLMVKYTAGSPAGNAGSGFTQSLRSSVGFSRQASEVGNTLRWRAMSNVDGHFSADPGGPADGCGTSGWCEFYTTVDTSGNVALYVVKNSDANTETQDAGDGPVEIKYSTRLDTVNALLNGGSVLKTITLNNLEKLPTLIDDRLAQVDTDLDGTWLGTGSTECLLDPTKCGGEGFGMLNGNPSGAEPAQALFTQFQVVSGPNFHSEEGADPYAWVICGSRTMQYGEDNCAADAGNKDNAVDSQIGTQRYVMAIVFNSKTPGALGDSVLKRFGADINPGKLDIPPQDTGVYVVCMVTTTATVALPGTEGNIVYKTDPCYSDPGGDGFYGSIDDGTIYYKEAVENHLRGWVRETNGHAFSFLGADFNSGDGKDPNFGLTQMVQQNIEGFLMSCLGCNPHSLPENQETVTYRFDWPGNFNISRFDHPPASTTTITILNGTP